MDTLMYSLVVNEYIFIAPGEITSVRQNSIIQTLLYIQYPRNSKRRNTAITNDQPDDVRSSKSSAHNLNSALFTDTIPLVDLGPQPDRS